MWNLRHRLALSALQRRFTGAFGIPLPEALLPTHGLRRLRGRVAAGLMVGTPEAAARPFLARSDSSDFLRHALEGHSMAGFWGQGGDSESFYYVRADQRSRIWFRLPFGGANMDNDDLAVAIRDFLTAFARFDAWLASRAVRLAAIQDAWGGYYEVIAPNEDAVVVERSFLYYPEFESVFADAVEDMSGGAPLPGSAGLR